MLAALGLRSLDELTDARRARVASGPTRCRSTLPPAALRDGGDRRAAGARRPQRGVTSLIGMGYYGTITPAVILRNVLENPAWYTAYTPYQPEISQGRLEALLNFQTMVADLTGMALANASLLDEATAAAEAMAMCRRPTREAGDRSSSTPTASRRPSRWCATRAEPLGIEVVVGDLGARLPAATLLRRAAAVPGPIGRVRDHAVDRRAPTSAAPWSRSPPTCSRSPCSPRRASSAPTSWSARPSASACRSASAVRTPASSPCATASSARCPAGWSGCRVDAAGRPAYRLALQTREQHIRREKATSNICTAQVLLAVAAACYAVYHGPEGLARIARRAHRLAAILAAGLRVRGVGDRRGPARHPRPDGVEERVVEDLDAARAQARGEHGGHAVDPAGDPRQPVRAVVDRVAGRGDGEQHLRRADVRGGLLAADVLLAGLQGQPQRGAAVDVVGEPDEPAGQLAGELVAHREVARVRTAEPERHPEALGGADGHVGPELAGRGEQGEGQQVGGDGNQRAAFVRGVDDRAQVAHGARRAGVGQQHAVELPSGSPSAGSNGTSSMPRGAARVASTSRVCGSVSTSTRNRGLVARLARRSSVMASAAAVASSSSEAPATGRPVRSATVVWNVSSASSLPWLISGWYGV